MANDRAFTHITVSADDDDDVVIQAGVIEDDEPDQVIDMAEDAACETSSLEEPGAQEAEVPAEAADSPSSVGAAVADDPVSPPAPRAQGGKVDDYHETTLEDIESEKMGSVQKVVIVVALLAIAAFVAWYLLAR